MVIIEDKGDGMMVIFKEERKLAKELKHAMEDKKYNYHFVHDYGVLIVTDTAIMGARKTVEELVKNPKDWVLEKKTMVG